MNVIAPLLVVAAGCSVALQQLLNANLGKALQSPWWAGFVSYLGGTFVMAAILVISGEPLSNYAYVARAPAISWAGGVFGAIFIATCIVMVPRLGVAAVVTLVVAGQLLSSILFDHYGLLSTPQHPITLVRLIGAGFLIAGAAMMRM
jgi:transporter family-2 protein